MRGRLNAVPVLWFSDKPSILDGLQRGCRANWEKLSAEEGLSPAICTK